jgi:hypothetical protein
MIRKIEVERFALSSSKPFDQVVAAFNSAVGHPVESLRDGRIPIPEVTIKGRSEPTSAAPSASIARLSASQLALNFEKS